MHSAVVDWWGLGIEPFRATAIPADRREGYLEATIAASAEQANLVSLPALHVQSQMIRIA